MALTDKQAFNFGFLSRCAEEGLTTEQSRDRIKLAHFVLDREKAATGSVIGDILGKIHGAGMGGLALSGLAGAGIGYGLGNMGRGMRDPKELKMEELADAYRQHAERARRATERRRRRRNVSAPRAPRLVM